MTQTHNTKRLAKEIKALRKKSQKNKDGLSSHEADRFRKIKGRLIKLTPIEMLNQD
jgi:hypothetical protein